MAWLGVGRVSAARTSTAWASASVTFWLKGWKPFDSTFTSYSPRARSESVSGVTPRASPLRLTLAPAGSLTTASVPSTGAALGSGAGRGRARRRAGRGAGLGRGRLAAGAALEPEQPAEAGARHHQQQQQPQGQPDREAAPLGRPGRDGRAGAGSGAVGGAGGGATAARAAASGMRWVDDITIVAGWGSSAFATGGDASTGRFAVGGTRNVATSGAASIITVLPTSGAGGAAVAAASASGVIITVGSTGGAGGAGAAACTGP